MTAGAGRNRDGRSRPFLFEQGRNDRFYRRPPAAQGPAAPGSLRSDSRSSPSVAPGSPADEPGPGAGWSPLRVRVRMIAVNEGRDPIANYTRELLAALARRVEVDVVSPAALRARPEIMWEGTQLAHVQIGEEHWNALPSRRGGVPAVLAGMRVPVVMTVHGLDEASAEGGGLLRRLAVARRRERVRRDFVPAAVSAWIVHAEGQSQALCRLGAPRERIHVLPLPVPARRGTPPDAERARRLLGLGGRRVLTLTGPLCREHGLALEALAQLSPEYVLLCAGGDPPQDRSGTEAWLRARARVLGVADRVVITGRTPASQMPRVMAATDLVLAAGGIDLPGLGSALAWDVPVLAAEGEACCAPDCVARFPAGDAAALAVRIQGLLNSPGEQCERQLRAARYARAHDFDWLAEETVQIYRAVLEGQGAAPVREARGAEKRRSAPRAHA